METARRGAATPGASSAANAAGDNNGTPCGARVREPRREPPAAEVDREPRREPPADEAPEAAGGRRPPPSPPRGGCHRTPASVGPLETRPESTPCSNMRREDSITAIARCSTPDTSPTPSTPRGTDAVAAAAAGARASATTTAVGKDDSRSAVPGAVGSALRKREMSKRRSTDDMGRRKGLGDGVSEHEAKSSVAYKNCSSDLLLLAISRGPRLLEHWCAQLEA